MELHPLLEPGAAPVPGLWHVLSPARGGGAQCPPPSMRVGHTATQLGSKVYVVGGANPSGPFAETFILDAESMTWECIDGPAGLRAR